MAMNAYLGGFGGLPIGTGNMPAYTLYLKYSDLVRPGADRIYVFVDEREDAINWGNAIIDMTGYSPTNPNLYRFLVPNCTSSRYAEKRQGTAALQDASAFFGTLLLPQGFGVRLSSAAFIALISAGKH